MEAGSMKHGDAKRMYGTAGLRASIRGDKMGARARRCFFVAQGQKGTVDEKVGVE
jgi:hypothetical protein